MKERIEKLIDESNLKILEKEEVKTLFDRLWYQYYIGGIDTHFVSQELKSLWFMYKIAMLTGMTTYHDLKAINLLTKELNANANVFLNRDHAIKEFV